MQNIVPHLWRAELCNYELKICVASRRGMFPESDKDRSFCDICVALCHETAFDDFSHVSPSAVCIEMKLTAGSNCGYQHDQIIELTPPRTWGLLAAAIP